MTSAKITLNDTRHLKRANQNIFLPDLFYNKYNFPSIKMYHIFHKSTVDYSQMP